MGGHPIHPPSCLPPPQYSLVDILVLMGCSQAAWLPNEEASVAFIHVSEIPNYRDEP